MLTGHHIGIVTQNEAGPVEGIGKSAHSAIGVVDVVICTCIAGINLDILVTVVFLLLGEIDGGVHLVI